MNSYANIQEAVFHQKHFSTVEIQACFRVREKPTTGCNYRPEWKKNMGKSQIRFCRTLIAMPDWSGLHFKHSEIILEGPGRRKAYETYILKFNLLARDQCNEEGVKGKDQSESVANLVRRDKTHSNIATE